MLAMFDDVWTINYVMETINPNIAYMSGLRSTESQSSDRMPRLEELSSLPSPGQARARGSKWGKMKEAFRWERSPVAETAGTRAEDTATCRIKQKFAQLTSSSSSCSLHSEAAYSRGEETELASSLQRSSSVTRQIPSLQSLWKQFALS